MKPSKTQQSYFDIAKKISEFSTFHRSNIRVGCIVIYRHRIISSGFNSDKTSPIQKKYNQIRFNEDTPHSLHAEISALSSLLWRDFDIDWSQVSLYIYRERQDHSLGKSRPCPSCMRLIQDLGIRDIYYTTEEGYCHEILN